ncbi:cyclin-O protein B isoform X1 [Lepeophtheirus salmonis]|nr:cyclin-O protein B-like isoform X1 [Lepeophtheirus salmonis]
MKRSGDPPFEHLYNYEGIQFYEMSKCNHHPHGKKRPNAESSPPSKKFFLSHPRFKDSSVPFRCENLSEYAVDVYVWKKSLEPKYSAGNCLEYQNDITEVMRGTVLRWLIAVNRQFDFTLETWCLSVNFLDRFLCQQALNRDCLQLAGLTAFFLAAKQEEVDPPEISELVTLCARSFERKHFRYMEYILLNHLHFDFLAPTPSYFLLYLVEMEKLSSTWPYWISRHVIERILCDYTLSRKLPSEISHAVFEVFSPISNSFVPETGESKLDPRIHLNPLNTSYEGHEDLINDYYCKVVDKLIKQEGPEESTDKEDEIEKSSLLCNFLLDKYLYI